MAKQVIYLVLCKEVQWNLSVTTTSIMKFITCDLYGNLDELQKAEKYPIRWSL